MKRMHMCMIMRDTGITPSSLAAQVYLFSEDHQLSPQPLSLTFCIFSPGKQSIQEWHGSMLSHQVQAV